MYRSIPRLCIHLDTVPNSNNSGTTPSIGRTLGCSRCLLIITFVQYPWTNSQLPTNPKPLPPTLKIFSAESPGYGRGTLSANT